MANKEIIWSKIYDFSEQEYVEVFAYPENFPFLGNMAYNIETLIFEISFSIPLHQYNNLISFYVLPEDNTVSSVMLDIQDNISAVFGEGVSAQYYQENSSWQGSLIDLDIASGYWLRMEDVDTLDAFGYPINPGRMYNLHEGANLVSFPIPGSVSISEGLPDDIE